MRLHGYFRSSAAWRVRIALALKGIEAEPVAHHLLHGGQRSASYLALNPQGLVPALETGGGAVLTQSLAIIEWLDETCPDPPLLPADPIERAHVRAFALAIACEIHPLQNLKVLRSLKALGIDQRGWARDVIADGFAACEALLAGVDGPYCFGGRPTIADICLVPQMANAQRFGVDLAACPRLTARVAACLALPAFSATAPETQSDAE